jgi:putative copper resistance protein D
MSDFLALTRAIHFSAVLWLLGEFVFFAFVLGRATGLDLPKTSATGDGPAARLTFVASVCVAIAIASAVAWLLIESANMSGAPLAVALDRQTLATVLGQTLFGRIWICRLAISALLVVALLVARRRSRRLAGPMLPVLGTVLAGAYAMTLAWTGHATAETGVDRTVHLTSDALHVLAAGAWVGALPALIAVLRRATDAQEEWALAAFATRRFSTLGVLAVAALLLTGVVNAFYLVGSVAALFGTTYGRLLMCKLLLFAFMLALAALNRLREMPQLPGRTPVLGDESMRKAVARLRRNATMEIAAGVAVVGIVSVLGITMPAAHMAHHMTHDTAHPMAHDMQPMPTMNESHGR